MTDVLRLALVAILLAIGFACYFLVLGALFAGKVAKTINVARQMPGRSFGIGLVNFLFFGSIAIALFAVSEGVNNGIIKFILLIPALAIAGVLVVILSLGLAAMINIIGESVFPKLSEWRKTFWGTVILAFACAIPTVGWFLLLPYVGCVGIGAVILGFFQRERV